MGITIAHLKFRQVLSLNSWRCLLLVEVLGLDTLCTTLRLSRRSKQVEIGRSRRIRARDHRVVYASKRILRLVHGLLHHQHHHLLLLLHHEGHLLRVHGTLRLQHIGHFTHLLDRLHLKRLKLIGSLTTSGSARDRSVCS